MRDNVLSEISDILGSFDINEISRLIKDQINSDYENDPSTEMLTNHFSPLYVNYSKIVNSDDYTKEVKDEVERHFIEICEIFLNAICDKFHLSINQEWKDDNYKNIPGITMAMYSFFVLDFATNVYEVVLNYILKNAKDIYRTFEGLKNKKDASTLANKKILSPEFSLIASNIYDISMWILQQITEEEFFDYLPKSYLPLKLMRKLFADGYIVGDFVDVVADIFSASIQLRSQVGFTIISKIRTGEIKDPFDKSSDN